MSKLYFDHIYSSDHQHRFLHKLKKFGFALMDHTVEHPGGLICRFIMFPSENVRRKNYLEFIHVKPRGQKVRAPGISFGTSGGAEKFHLQMKRERRLQSIFVHKNYAWKENSKDKLPGWNFVMFKNYGFRSLYPWLTEYEPRPDQKNQKANPQPNGVNQIHGIVMEVNPNGAKFFRSLLRREPKGVLKLPCGTRIYFSTGRTTQVKSVVLKAKSFKVFTRKFSADELLMFNGQPAALIKNPTRGMWNILII